MYLLGTLVVGSFGCAFTTWRRVDGDANQNLYGNKVSSEQIYLRRGITTPDQARPLIGAIQQATAKAVEQNK